MSISFVSDFLFGLLPFMSYLLWSWFLDSSSSSSSSLYIFLSLCNPIGKMFYIWLLVYVLEFHDYSWYWVVQYWLYVFMWFLRCSWKEPSFFFSCFFFLQTCQLLSFANIKVLLKANLDGVGLCVCLEDLYDFVWLQCMDYQTLYDYNL